MRLAIWLSMLPLVGPAAALDFQSDSLEAFGLEAARRVVEAEAQCTDTVDRHGACTPKIPGSRDAILKMSRAGVAITNYYLKCEPVMWGNEAWCDALMSAMLREERERANAP